jgi:hypothetical protein
MTFSFSQDTWKSDGKDQWKNQFFLFDWSLKASEIEEYWYDKEKHFVVVFFSFDDNCHLLYQIELKKRKGIFL